MEDSEEKYTNFENELKKLPNAALLCIAILLYTVVIVISLIIRRCLLQRGLCSEPCPSISCGCSDLILRIAEFCSCCPAHWTFSTLLDKICPSKDTCSDVSCNFFGICNDCLLCDTSTECCDCPSCSTFCYPLIACMPACPSCGDRCKETCLSGISCCSCECTSINCLCCEISIKGRGGPLPSPE